ncbi:hypothetical protein SAMN05216403_14121 [Nitrosospira multiformis ATCC 25196]|uniref:Uncharacterized protein n=1 Tax=Nitrosospira multiformis (strain ATCC 25196 / NCIMB 11849 / C 71) TaxID=323848 RepID=A0A1H5Y0F7_NITMU|nr:hypothetical protein [Nitrosospira multiformis]SEG17413.1 hypothetical protein SAMN05216403_14121 [Nitrosospira multiformis ATCC 25196]
MLSLDWFTLARVALLYDLLGALILVWGFASQGEQEYSEADAFYKEDDLKKVVATKVDSIVGLSFIVMGFFGQLVGSDNAVSTAFLSSQVYVMFALIGVAPIKPDRMRLVTGCG